MKKVIYCIIAVACFFTLSIHAQSAEKISKLLESQEATVAQAAYLAATYREFIPETAANSTEADVDKLSFETLKEKGYISKNTSPDDPITLAQACYIYAKIMNVKGGIFYTIFPSERYAFKEFKAKKIIPSTADPAMKMSGRDTLDLFNGLIKTYEGVAK